MSIFVIYSLLIQTCLGKMNILMISAVANCVRIAVSAVSEMFISVDKVRLCCESMTFKQSLYFACGLFQ